MTRNAADQFRRGRTWETPTLTRLHEVDGDTVRTQLESTLENHILNANAELRKYPQIWRDGLNWVCRIPELDYDRIKLKYRLETPADLARLKQDHPEYFVRESV